MSHRLPKNSSYGHARVNIRDECELAYWSEKFDVSDEELKRAVDEIGETPRDLERYFEKKQRNRAYGQHNSLRAN